MECLGNCNACENARCALEYEDEKQKEEGVKMGELKPCPFCGGIEVKIQICDEEGNFREEEYEQDPWLGLNYMLIHTASETDKCPMACCYKNKPIGTWLYDNQQEAMEVWNKRI